MAITTDSYIDVRDTLTVLQDKIGLSKTLDNYTMDEITAYCYCGADNNLIRYPVQRSDVQAFLSGIDVPLHVENTGTNKVTLTQGDPSLYAGSSGIYGRVIWLKYTLSGSPHYVITSSLAAHYKLVTELKANHYCYEWTAPSTFQMSSNTYGTTDWSGSDMSAHKAWKCSRGWLSYYKDFEGGEIIDLSAETIHPYFITEINGKIFCFAVSTNICSYKSNYNYTTASLSDPPATGYNYSSWDGSDSFDVAYAAMESWDATFANTGWNFPYNYAINQPGLYGWVTILQGFADDKVTGFGVVGGSNNSLYMGWKFDYYFHERDDVYKLLSGAGLYFKTDKIYKPVISNGYVTGYTDDLTTPSDIDSWQGSTNHNIPPSPPGPVPPGGDDDNDDPVNTAGAPFAAGLCHYYALTAGSVLLEHISEALGTWDIENTHKDLYKNLVSCKLVKPPAAIPTTGSEAFTIYGVKPQYQGADITLPVVSGNPDASFGPYTIDRKFNDFRDYAPYTRVSIYLPYCGWCDLPSHVVGRKVSVKYFTDIIAATCKAVVFCGNNIIAEAAGVIGLDIPFVADNVGAKMQAVTAGMIAALGGGIQLGAGIGTMAATKSGSGAKAALSGASQYLSGYSQMAMAFNENTTEISGKNGDGCCLSGATNIIIKIVRPKKGAYTDAPYVPPGYSHNVGFVSQKQVRVSSVSGLLIADNVDTSGISGATEAERAEIKRVLETGLIVNAAPE